MTHSIADAQQRARFYGPRYCRIDDTYYLFTEGHWSQSPSNIPGARYKTRPNDERDAEKRIGYFGKPGQVGLHVDYSRGISVGSPSSIERIGLVGTQAVVTGTLIDLLHNLSVNFELLKGAKTEDNIDNFLATWRHVNLLIARYIGMDSVRSFLDGETDNGYISSRNMGRSPEGMIERIFSYVCPFGFYNYSGEFTLLGPLPDKLVQNNSGSRLVLNPWTREVTRVRDRGLRNPEYNISKFEVLIRSKDEGKKEVYIHKASLRPIDHPLSYHGQNVVGMYPPLPIPDSEMPIRPFSKKDRTGVFLMMGVELETNLVGASRPNGIVDHPGCARLLTDVTSQWPVVPMRDSSISGCEFIGVPGVLNSQKIMWAGVLGIINKHGFLECGDNTGLHVHVSRPVFTPVTLAKVSTFINSIDPAIAELITAIAGRTEQHHCTKDKHAKVSDAVLAGNRNAAVNLTNRSTVEFRLFRADLDPHKLFMRLEFVDAIIRWAITESPSFKALTAEAFKKYVLRNRRSYPELTTFLRKDFS